MRKIFRGAWAMAGLALTASGPAPAQTTMQTLLDRAQIEDMIVDYYSQLGRPKKAGFGDSYTDDGELVLGERSIKGKAAIEAMYKSLSSSGAAPPATMNVLVNNPRITVTGNTAHGEFIYTGILVPSPNKAPVLHEQGREIDEFVKVNGAWKIKKRTIISDANEGAAAGG